MVIGDKKPSELRPKTGGVCLELQEAFSGPHADGYILGGKFRIMVIDTARAQAGLLVANDPYGSL
jgi:hypothetical protein